MQKLHLQIAYIFTQLTSLANTILEFTNSEWPSSSSSHDESLQFGIAMDIILPEVKCPLLYQCLLKNYDPHSPHTIVPQVAVHSFMEADGLSYEEAFDYYYN